PTTAPATQSATAVQNYLNTITNAGGFQGVPTNPAVGAPVTTLNGNTAVFGQNNGPYYVVFRNALAFTDVPRFFAKASIGTTMSVVNTSGINDVARIPEGPSIALSFTPLGGAAQQTRPLSFAGRNGSPSATDVQNALNELPALSALGAPVSVSAASNVVQTMNLGVASGPSGSVSLLLDGVSGNAVSYTGVVTASSTTVSGLTT